MPNANRAFGSAKPKLRRRLSGGISLVETMLALIVFALLVIVFAATFPTALHAGGAGAAYNQAALLAQHKTEQLRQAGFSQLNASALSAMGIVDSTQNADGSLSFTNIDNLVDNGSNKGYFGPGSTGKIVISRALSGQGTSAPALSQCTQATITISWRGSGLQPGSFETHTIIAAPP